MDIKKNKRQDVIHMPSKAIPSNVIKYVVILAVLGYSGRELHIPDYGMEIAVYEISKLSFSQLSLISTIGSVVGVILLVAGGILADKHGRRLTWALSLIFYQIGLLWLLVSPSFESALFSGFLIGSSYMFVCSSLAWFFDFEGKEGLRKAYGLLRMILALSVTLGIANIVFFNHFLNARHELALTSIISISCACWIMTFQENFGSRSNSCVQIFKTGIRQIFSSRVLRLIVLSAIFVDFQFWISDHSFLLFLDKFHVGYDEITLFGTHFTRIWS